MEMYKGFDKDLKCRDFQFEIGKSYHEDTASLCETGFHACENPLDVFSYYPPDKSRYCKVMLDGVTEETENDSKRCGTDIRVESEVELSDFIRLAATTGNGAHAATTGYGAHAATTGCGAHAATTGDYAHAATTGNGAHAATTGDYAHAATTGYGAHAATTGYSAHAKVNSKSAFAVALGIDSFAAAPVGGFIILSDWRKIDNCIKLYGAKTFQVDGETIKGDTYYKLENGQLVEES